LSVFKSQIHRGPKNKKFNGLNMVPF